ncbi:hypothetical protein RHMOL_Rhmol03G0082700 [Rhododendron molle]|uniref:Uncharacterized protein n=1 Tax=Rhododendron molle TaxID=49168 RepID=A0ACC0PBM5_RHOML|nr:hypothetical protein RHMOL_Rhmol03G0082700 [Rhododendron molle]
MPSRNRGRESTLDTPLAMGGIGFLFAICSPFTSLEWNVPEAIATFGNSLYSGSGESLGSGKQITSTQNR